MIRVLVMIAVTGFLVSVVTLSSAIAIGGPELITDAARNGWGNWAWDTDDWGHHGSRHWDRDSGPEGSRELAWSGSDTLDIDVPAQITYTQAPGPGKLTISGSQRMLDNLVLEGGHLTLRHGRHRSGDLTIVMTAPAVSRFNLNGSGELTIKDYKQDKLSLDVTGDTHVNVRGETKGLTLSISGSGETDLAELKVSDADVDIDGSGQATLAATGAVNVNISGSGEVSLLTHPSKLESNVSGSGSIHQSDGSAVTPAAPTPPATPEAPKKPKPART